MTAEEDVFDALKYNVTCDEFGTRVYCNDAGRLHRENGPAVVQPSGRTLWYSHDVRKPAP